MLKNKILSWRLLSASSRVHYFCTENFSNVILARIDDVYCFHSRISKNFTPKFDGWSLFDIQNEFQRQGVPNSEWTLTYLNTSYELCDTYPRYLYVPSTCTNSILVGSAKFRSKGRLPVLTYLHSNKV